MSKEEKDLTLKTTDVVLYVKHIKDDIHKTEFDKPFISYARKRFECVLADGCGLDIKRLKKDNMLPSIVTLSEDDYFMKKKSYDRNDGTKGVKWVMVITSHQAIVKTEFEKITIDDVVKDLDNAEVNNENGEVVSQ